MPVAAPAPAAMISVHLKSAADTNRSSNDRSTRGQTGKSTTKQRKKRLGGSRHTAKRQSSSLQELSSSFRDLDISMSNGMSNGTSNGNMAVNPSTNASTKTVYHPLHEPIEINGASPPLDKPNKAVWASNHSIAKSSNRTAATSLMSSLHTSFGHNQDDDSFNYFDSPATFACASPSFLSPSANATFSKDSIAKYIPPAPLYSPAPQPAARANAALTKKASISSSSTTCATDATSDIAPSATSGSLHFNRDIADPEGPNIDDAASAMHEERASAQLPHHRAHLTKDLRSVSNSSSIVTALASNTNLRANMHALSPSNITTTSTMGSATFDTIDAYNTDYDYSENNTNGHNDDNGHKSFNVLHSDDDDWGNINLETLVDADQSLRMSMSLDDAPINPTAHSRRSARSYRTGAHQMATTSNAQGPKPRRSTDKKRRRRSQHATYSRDDSTHRSALSRRTQASRKEKERPRITSITVKERDPSKHLHKSALPTHLDAADQPAPTAAAAAGATKRLSEPSTQQHRRQGRKQNRRSSMPSSLSPRGSCDSNDMVHARPSSHNTDNESALRYDAALVSPTVREASQRRRNAEAALRNQFQQFHQIPFHDGDNAGPLVVDTSNRSPAEAAAPTQCQLAVMEPRDMDTHTNSKCEDNDDAHLSKLSSFRITTTTTTTTIESSPTNSPLLSPPHHNATGRNNDDAVLSDPNQVLYNLQQRAKETSQLAVQQLEVAQQACKAAAAFSSNQSVPLDALASIQNITAPSQTQPECIQQASPELDVNQLLADRHAPRTRRRNSIECMNSSDSSIASLTDVFVGTVIDRQPRVQRSSGMVKSRADHPSARLSGLEAQSLDEPTPIRRGRSLTGTEPQQQAQCSLAAVNQTRMANDTVKPRKRTIVPNAGKLIDPLLSESCSSFETFHNPCVDPSYTPNKSGSRRRNSRKTALDASTSRQQRRSKSRSSKNRARRARRHTMAHSSSIVTDVPLNEGCGQAVSRAQQRLQDRRRRSISTAKRSDAASPKPSSRAQSPKSSSSHGRRNHRNRYGRSVMVNNSEQHRHPRRRASISTCAADVDEAIFDAILQGKTKYLDKEALLGPQVPIESNRRLYEPQSRRLSSNMNSTLPRYNSRSASTTRSDMAEQANDIAPLTSQSMHSYHDGVFNRRSSNGYDRTNGQDSRQSHDRQATSEHARVVNNAWQAVDCLYQRSSNALQESAAFDDIGELFEQMTEARRQELKHQATPQS